MKHKTVIKTQASHKNLLFAELIIVIFFFAISAAGCVMLFAQAKLDGIYSQELTEAVVEAQNAAECFKAAGGDLEMTARLMGTYYVPGSGNIYIIYNDEWEEIPEKTSSDLNEKYYLILNTIENNGLVTAKIDIYNKKEIVYQLTAAAVKEAR